MYYCFDTKSLANRASIKHHEQGRRPGESSRLRISAVRQPAINLQIAQAYLQHGDPVSGLTGRSEIIRRTTVVHSKQKPGPNRERWTRVTRINRRVLYRIPQTHC